MEKNSPCCADFPSCTSPPIRRMHNNYSSLQGLKSNSSVKAKTIELCQNTVVQRRQSIENLKKNDITWKIFLRNFRSKYSVCLFKNIRRIMQKKILATFWHYNNIFTWTLLRYYQIQKRPTKEYCLKQVYSIWFVTLQSFWLCISTCKDVCQQANIVRRKIVVQIGLEPATSGLQS